MDLDDDEVLALLKALYDIQQAGRCWFRHLVKILKRMGLRQLKSSPTIFFSDAVIVSIYVDDGLLAEKVSGGAQRFVAELPEHLEITVELELNGLLGLDIRQENDGSVCVSQAAYVKETLKLYQMDQAKPQAVPAAAGVVLSKLGAPRPQNDKFDVQGPRSSWPIIMDFEMLTP